jgi:hypothetical protein
MKIPSSYTQAKDFVGDRNKRTIQGKRATYILRETDSGTGEVSYSLHYHNTPVAFWHNDGSVCLNAGNYRSVTTKSRINDAIRGKGYVFQHKHEWYYQAADSERKIPFANRMIVNHLEAFR